MKEVVLGIDIGGTYTKYGLTSRDGKILLEGKISSEEHASINDFIHTSKI
jgi:glucokinase